MDLVERSLVIDVINRSDYDLEYHDEAEMMIDDIRSIPSAPPEKRHTGKWMLLDNQRQEDIRNGNYMYTCSNCLHSDVHAKSVKVPYCWFCGAEMADEGKQ